MTGEPKAAKKVEPAPVAMIGQPHALGGRKDELGILSSALENARGGRGGCVLVLGEPGIGKTRLLDEFKKAAESKGALLLCGAAKADSAKPFHPFAEALADRLPRGWFSPGREVGFKDVFIVDEKGGMVSGEPTGGAGTMAGMLSAVQSFVRDSFQGGTGSLGRLEYGETKVLIEHGAGIFMVGIVEGEEPEGMAGALRDALQSMQGRLGEVLHKWPEDLREILVAAPELRTLRAARFHVRRSLEGVSLENERARISDAVARTLRELAGKGTVALVLEDMHWADPSSLFLLTYVARNAKGANMLIVSTARTGEGDAFQKAREAMAAEETATELLLGGLSEGEVAGLVGALYPGNEFDEAFLNKLVEDSRGNPLFVIEVLRQLETEGGIARERGAYVLAKEDYSMPGSVEEVVRRRLDSLDPDTLTEAEYASCIGVDFPQDAALSIETLADARAALEKLAGSGIFVADGAGWRFSHALFRQVVYTGMSKRWRASHHRSLGAYYERRFQGSLYDAAYELARHFKGCGDWAKALDYCIMAGEKAESSYAIEQALEFYESALGAMAKFPKTDETPAREARLLERAGEMELKLGMADRAIERFGKVRALAPDDPATVLRTAMRRRTAYAIKNDRNSALEEMQVASAWLARAPAETRAEFLGNWVASSLHIKTDEAEAARAREALSCAVEVADPVKRSTIFVQVGRFYEGLQEYEKAMSIIQKSMQDAELSGDSRALAEAYSEMGLLLHFLTDHVQSAAYLEKAAAYRERLGDIVALAQTLGTLGMAYSDSGNLEMSVSCLKRALATYRKIGAEDSAATTLGNMGYSLALMGRNEEALLYQRESLALRIKRHGEPGGSWSYFDMSIVYNNMGELERERECLEKADAIFSSGGEKFGLAQTRMGLGDILLRSGDVEGARRCFKDALEIASSADMTAMVLAAKRYLIEAGGPSEAGGLDDLTKEAEKLGDKGLLMSMAEAGAKLALMGGELARAAECAQRGLDTWKGMKSRDMDGQAASLMLIQARAKALGGDAGGAAAIATEASRIAGGCGRAWLSRQAEEFVRSLRNTTH